MVGRKFNYYNIYIKRIFKGGFKIVAFFHSFAQQLLSPLLLVLCFYFTLTYLHHLKKDDDRAIKKAKWAAVLSLGLALVVPALYNVITFMIMMR